jgi:hypothetical protein
LVVRSGGVEPRMNVRVADRIAASRAAAPTVASSWSNGAGASAAEDDHIAAAAPA